MSYLRMVKMAVMPCFFAFYIQQQITCNRFYVYISNLIWRVRQKENIKCIYTVVPVVLIGSVPPYLPISRFLILTLREDERDDPKDGAQLIKSCTFTEVKPINRAKISISYKVSMYTCCCFILFYKFKLERGCTRGEQRLEGNCKPGKTEIAMSEIQYIGDD